jgi:hypothetical protein
MGLQHAWLAKITDEALITGKEPALSITFVDEQGRPKKSGAWICIRETLYAAILQSIAKEE